MADISKISLPSGTEYDLKDASARSSLAEKQDVIDIDTLLNNSGSLLSVAIELGYTQSDLESMSIEELVGFIANLGVNYPESTDENVKTNPKTSAGAYYLAGPTAFTTTTGELVIHPSLSAYVTSNSETDGYTRLDLGNSTAISTAGGKEGIIRMYGPAASNYLELKTLAANSNKTITFPNITGTVALTSDIPTSTSALTNDSGYITLDDIPTVPTIRLNGVLTTTPEFYAPTTVGSSGQYLKSSGTANTAPTWANFPTIPSITLNGSASTSPSFYAPTTAGTSGYYLKSNGSGAPTWANFPSIPSAGTSASEVGTASSGGSAATWSKSDHVHKISSSTITTALGYTPCDSARVKSASNIVNTEYNTTSERGKLADMSWLSFWNGTWNGTSSNLLAQKVAYITAQGISGDWRYRVWSNNFIEVWFNGSVTFTAAGASYQGWYRSVINVTIPTAVRNTTGAFADTANVQVTGAYNAHIFTSGGIKSSGTAFEAQVLGGSALAANTTASGWNVYISGYKR